MFSLQKYKLNWQAYEGHIKQMMETMLVTPEYADVTLITDDAIPIKANKAVLSSCSPVFKSIIENSNHHHPLVYMRGINYQELQPLIHFIYLGEAAIEEQQIEEFIKLAKSLAIKDINDDDFPSPDIKTKPTETNGRFDSEDNDFNRMKNDQNQHLVSKQEKENFSLNYLASNQGFITANEYDVKPTITVEESVKNNQRGRPNNRKIVSHNCQECNFQTSKKEEIKKHWNNKHSKEHFGCSECLYYCKSEGQLSFHIDANHPHLKPKLTFKTGEFGILMN